MKKKITSLILFSFLLPLASQTLGESTNSYECGQDAALATTLGADSICYEKTVTTYGSGMGQQTKTEFRGKCKPSVGRYPGLGVDLHTECYLTKIVVKDTSSVKPSYFKDGKKDIGSLLVMKDNNIVLCRDGGSGGIRGRWGVTTNKTEKQTYYLCT